MKLDTGTTPALIKYVSAAAGKARIMISHQQVILYTALLKSCCILKYTARQLRLLNFHNSGK